MSMSVLTLALKEVVGMQGCLESLAWCDDVVVLESRNTDRMEEIVSAAGAYPRTAMNGKAGTAA